MKIKQAGDIFMDDFPFLKIKQDLRLLCHAVKEEAVRLLSIR